MRTRNAKWSRGETISVSIGQGAFTSTPLQLAMATAITANQGNKVIPHVLRESRGAKPFKVHNGTHGKIDFNGQEEDWIKMREAMVDVIQSGTGRGIKSGLQYSIAGKTGTAQVKSIAQGKRYNESLLTDRQLDHGLLSVLPLLNSPKLRSQSFWKMVVVVVRQPPWPDQFSITGYCIKIKSNTPTGTPIKWRPDDSRNQAS